MSSQVSCLGTTSNTVREWHRHDLANCFIATLHHSSHVHFSIPNNKPISCGVVLQFPLQTGFSKPSLLLRSDPHVTRCNAQWLLCASIGTLNTFLYTSPLTPLRHLAICTTKKNMRCNASLMPDQTSVSQLTASSGFTHNCESTRI